MNGCSDCTRAFDGECYPHEVSRLRAALEAVAREVRASEDAREMHDGVLDIVAKALGPTQATRGGK